MGKLGQKGVVPPIILVVGLVIIVGLAGIAYTQFQPESSNTATTNQAVESSPNSTPSATPSASVMFKPTAKATTKPTPKATNTPKPTASSAPASSVRAEPSSINVTVKRSDLGSLPTIKIYAPGYRKAGILPRDGTVGIYGSFKGSGASFDEFTDSTEIKIGLADAFGRGIKSGENKEVLDIREGEDFLDAANKGESLISIPVTIIVTD